MSGGYFDYKQFHIEDIIEQVNELGKELTDPNPVPEGEWSPKLLLEDIDKFLINLKLARKYLIFAQTFTHRLDWFLSGDDGEESFYERLEEDLTKAGQRVEQDFGDIE